MDPKIIIVSTIKRSEKCSEKCSEHSGINIKQEPNRKKIPVGKKKKLGNEQK